jgi:hypothetical protein
MVKETFGGTCRMCERPYTIFKWRPGKHDSYKRAEVTFTFQLLCFESEKRNIANNSFRNVR